jgi:hypothetical protein
MKRLDLDLKPCLFSRYFREELTRLDIPRITPAPCRLARRFASQ